MPASWLRPEICSVDRDDLRGTFDIEERATGVFYVVFQSTPAGKRGPTANSVYRYIVVPLCASLSGSNRVNIGLALCLLATR